MKQDLWKRQFDRLLAFLLLFAVMFQMPVRAAGDEPNLEPDRRKPVVTLVGTSIKDRDLEIGLSVGSYDQGFQSLGAVIEFNAEALEPVGWSGDAAVDLSQAKDWDSAKELDTKGPDNLSGKTALVYLSEDGKTGYLYVSAEAPKPVLMAQAVPEGPIADKLTEAVPQVITVRMKYKQKPQETQALDGGATTDPVYYGFDEIQGLRLLEDTEPAAMGSPADGGLIYFDNTVSEPKAAERGKVLIKSGVSVNSGGGSADDFFPIVFYDWDETLLGSVIMAKDATREDILQTLNQFAAEIYANYTAGMNFPADLSGESYVEDSSKPLTYKKGYNFAGWVQVNGEGTPNLEDAFTAYPELGELTDGSFPKGTFKAEEWDYSQPPSGGWRNISLKAGYVENEMCNLSGYYYSNSVSTYNRIGTYGDGNFSISFNITRRNQENYGVTRLKVPAVRITLINGSTKIYVLQKIGKKDNEFVEVIVPKAVDEVKIETIDAAGNWLGAALKANTKVELADKYILDGTINFINEAALLAAQVPNGGTMPMEWNTYFDAPTCTELGFKLKGAAITVRNIATVRTNILKAFKDEQNNLMPLTKEQMQYAIDNGGQWIAP